MGKDNPARHDDLLDWGLNYPLDYIFPQFVRWYRSDFHALPDGDRYDEQDPQKMDDLFTLLALTDFHMRQLDRPASQATDNVYE